MGRKGFTFENIKEYVESQGYKLLSTEYKGSLKPIKVQCPEGHIYDVRWSNFYNIGQRCPVCMRKISGEKIRQSYLSKFKKPENQRNKKYTYEEVKEYIESIGYSLLSKEYINGRTKLKMMCDKCHEFDMSFSNFKQGHRCSLCNCKSRKTIEEVKEVIESVEGYKLLSTEYINSSSKLKIQCPDGHIYDVRYNSFQQGQRCPVCMRKITIEKTRLSYEEVKKNIESVEGYKLLSTEYIDCQTKLSIQCPEGHIFDMAYSNFNQGQRCSVCYGTPKYTIEEVREFIENEGYKLLSTEYINNSSKLDIECPEGHIFKMAYSRFQQGSRCSVCSRNNVRIKKYEEIKRCIEDKGYILLSKEYIDSNTNIKIQCSKGHIFETKYNSGYECPVCLKYNDVKQYVKSQGYTLLSEEFKGVAYKLKMMCNRGHEFDMVYNNFKNNGSRCPICKNEDIYKEVKSIIESKSGYKLLDKEVINISDKINIQCPEGHKYKVLFSSFKDGHGRCPICKEKIRYEEIKSTVESEKDYKLLNKINDEKRLYVEVQCPEGHIYKTRFEHWRKGNRCPICNNSKGEEKVKSILEEYNISYQKEKTFDGCVYKSKLRFDYYIPDMNTCIEYDGEQHFKPISFKGKKHDNSNESIQQFELNQLRDQIKDQYCKDNNIKLIRIPYTEFDNIEEILVKELNLKKVV